MKSNINIYIYINIDCMHETALNFAPLPESSDTEVKSLGSRHGIFLVEYQSTCTCRAPC